MVQSFGDSEDNTAFLVGLLIAVFTLSEFINATIWARASDNMGRKWTLLIGGFGSMISASLFGLSKSIYAAVAIRVFGGLVNPNVGIVQTCVGEMIKEKSHQGKSFRCCSASKKTDMLSVGTVIQLEHSRSCRFCEALGEILTQHLSAWSN